MKYIFFTFFGLMGLITPCWGQEQRSLPKDSIPRGIITLKDTVLNGNSTTLVVFHDDKGDISKIVEKSNFPDHSPFNNLPFQRINNFAPFSKGEIRYDISNLPITEKIKGIEQSGIKGIPIDNIRKTTTIIHHPIPGIILPQNNEKLLLTSSLSELANLGSEEPSFFNMYIEVYDHDGKKIKTLNINSCGRLSVSPDARYIVCESLIITRGWEYSSSYGPYLIYDMKKNKLDTIAEPAYYDIKYNRDVEQQSYCIFEDSLFQSIYISFLNPDEIIHVIIDPLKKYLFVKTYSIEELLQQGKNDFKFSSMRLPNGNRVNLDHYKRF